MLQALKAASENESKSIPDLNKIIKVKSSSEKDGPNEIEEQKDGKSKHSSIVKSEH